MNDAGSLAQVNVRLAGSRAELADVEPLMRRYLEWVVTGFKRTTGVAVDLDAYLANSMDHLDNYLPPRGCFAIAQVGQGDPVGMLLLRPLETRLAELKRLYVDPGTRGHGLGRRLIAATLAEARRLGYATLFLDSGSFMHSAHRLYADAGFVPTCRYEGSENDPALANHLIYMRLDLPGAAT